MLDRKSPHGHVFGAPGVVYEQAGKFYDAQGREVEFVEPETSEEEDTKPRRSRKPKDAA